MSVRARTELAASASASRTPAERASSRAAASSQPPLMHSAAQSTLRTAAHTLARTQAFATAATASASVAPSAAPAPKHRTADVARTRRFAMSSSSKAPAALSKGAGAAVWTPPPRVEDLYQALAGNKFAGTNAPTSGARTPNPVPSGDAGLQLYTLATPNGQKVGIMLEELAAAAGVKYDAHVVKLNGMQFDKGFVDINPNSKIPALLDRQPEDGGDPVRLFESGSIVLYLADKYKMFIPKDARGRAECMNWVMWQMGGQGPITGGGYGHFFVYAPDELNRDYPVARYGMDVKRMCHVLDTHLAGRRFICGDEYTVADMMCLPWWQQIRGDGYIHKSGVKTRDFLGTSEYKNLHRWADELVARPQVARGLLVGRKYGKPWLHDDRFTHLASGSKM